jgi:polysaccharide deacetylase 2 family uncharacterized protein YibQ
LRPIRRLESSLILFFLLLFACSTVARASGRILLVLDDLGHSIGEAREAACHQLPLEVAFSIIPGTPRSAEVGHACLVSGRDVLAHIPWEPLDNSIYVEKARLNVDCSPGRIQSVIDLAFRELPMMIGANNHQGSRASQSENFLAAFAHAWAENGLPFIDSRTIGQSRVSQVFRATGITVLENSMFLDHVDDPLVIRQRLKELEARAFRRDLTIAIAHPRESSLAEILRWARDLPEGLELVSARDVFTASTRDLLAESRGLKLETGDQP